MHPGAGRVSGRARRSAHAVRAGSEPLPGLRRTRCGDRDHRPGVAMRVAGLAGSAHPDAHLPPEHRGSVDIPAALHVQGGGPEASGREPCGVPFNLGYGTLTFQGCGGDVWLSKDNKSLMKCKGYIIQYGRHVGKGGSSTPSLGTSQPKSGAARELSVLRQDGVGIVPPFSAPVLCSAFYCRSIRSIPVALSHSLSLRATGM